MGRFGSVPDGTGVRSLIEETDLAYVAALIDGFALLRVRTTSEGTELPVISISSPKVEMLNVLGKMTGIKPFATNRAYDKHRCSEHCEAKHEHIVSTSNRWQITGAKATVVLCAIRPYLRVKGSEAEELIHVGLGAPYKPATLSKTADLGWPMPEGWSK